jgi:hypothetical protein
VNNSAQEEILGAPVADDDEIEEGDMKDEAEQDEEQP